jgi:dTDP-4-amino-4,6-dideoxygalactose transaminase
MTEIRIPFFRPAIDDEDVQAVVESMRSGWLTTGPNVAALERELAAYCGANYVNAVNSATAALHLCLAAWDVGPGDEVIAPVYTFSATANVAVHCGATPVLVDVREGDANIDPELVEAAITPRTKVIIPVDFAGEPCQMDAIMDIARRHGVKVLTDAAHSVGSMYRGRPVRSISDATAFSFYATKNMTTGEGGASRRTTGAERASAAADAARHHADGWNRYAAGGTWRYDIAEFGFKDNLTDWRHRSAEAARAARRVQRGTDADRSAYFANLRDESTSSCRRSTRRTTGRGTSSWCG